MSIPPVCQDCIVKADHARCEFALRVDAGMCGCPSHHHKANQSAPEAPDGP